MCVWAASVVMSVAASVAASVVSRMKTGISQLDMDAGGGGVNI